MLGEERVGSTLFWPILLLQVAKREEAIHKLKIEKLSLQEQQQKSEDAVSWYLCKPTENYITWKLVLKETAFSALARNGFW